MSHNATSRQNFSAALSADPIDQARTFAERRLSDDASPPPSYTTSSIRRVFNDWARTGQKREGFEALLVGNGDTVQVPAAVAEIDATPRAANVFRLALELTGTRPVKTEIPLPIALPVMTDFTGGPLSELTIGGKIESVANTDTTSIEFSEDDIILKSKTYRSGQAWLSITRLGGTNFDLATYLEQELQYAKELGLEADIATKIAADATITQGTTTASAATFTRAELVTLTRALPDVFDRLKVVVLSREAFETAEGWLDSAGNPVLPRDRDYPEILRVNGIPVMKCHAIEDFGADNVIGEVLSLAGFRLRDSSPRRVTRYANIPTRPDQIGFEIFADHAFGYTPSAIAKLKMHA